MERELERQKVELEDNDFQLRVRKKENEQLKEDMLVSDERLKKAQQEQERLAVVNNDLEMAILQCKSKAEEDISRFTKLESRIEELEQELAQSLNVNQEREEEAAALRSTIETRDLALADLMERCSCQEQSITELKQKL